MPMTFWRCETCQTPNPSASYVTTCIGCGAARPAFAPTVVSAAAGNRPPSATTKSKRGQRSTLGRRRQRTIPQWLALGAGVLSWGYLLAVVVNVIVMRTLGDQWWPATILLYGPRWGWLLPLALLLPSALVLSRRLLLPLGVAAILVIGPGMGFCMPWRTLAFWEGRSPGASMLRIVSCNVQGGQFNPLDLSDFLAMVGPDVVLFQEWNPTFQDIVFSEPGWHFVTERRLCIASRYPFSKAEALGQTRQWWGELALRCVLETPDGPIEIGNLHLETPRHGLEAFRYQGARGLKALRQSIERRGQVSEVMAQTFADRPQRLPLLLGGDFNMTADSPIFHRDWSNYRNAFSRNGFGFGYTKFESKFAARIDHLLVDEHWSIRECWVGPDFGSDHRPLVGIFSRP